MDYEQILNGCGEVGSRLLNGGAEIYRVEDTVRRLMAAYGVKGDVFAIPNCLIVSLEDEQGHTHTKLYRAVGHCSPDIEVIERFNALSRSVCAAPPEPKELVRLAEETGAACRQYSLWMKLLGYFVGALFFTFFFQGSVLDAVCAAVAGTVAGFCAVKLEQLKVNFFFKTIAAALVLGIIAYGLAALGLPLHTGAMVMGAMMVLVPGLVFTNFMCDIITGDVLSGVSSFIRAVLTAAAIALGAGAALFLFQWLGFDVGGIDRAVSYGFLAQCVISFFACCGFSLLYNVHGGGVILCCLGGALSWGIYLLAGMVTDSIYLCYLAAAIFVAVFAEIMARVRKYPITAYLVISYFPLVPGGFIYRTMYYGIQGEQQLFLETGLQTIGIAACLAMGVLLVSTTVRTVNTWRRERRMRRGAV